MTILSGKPKHLFMVKDGRLGADGKTVAAEHFSPEQKAIVERALAAIPRPGGVLVGAHFMDALWDVRPLVLEKGVMTLTRFSDPGLEPARREHLARVHGALSGVAGIVACGQSAGASGPQLWMRRKYFASTVGENSSTESFSMMHPIHLARRIIGYARYLESIGVVHGHLCPNNVVIEGENPVALDYGFAALGGVGGRYRDLAPEIARGGAPTPASDVYGLGLVLKHLLSSHLNHEQLGFIEKMSALEPGNRPVVGVVDAFFSGGAPTASTPNREVGAGGRIGAGRVVSSASATITAPPPAVGTPMSQNAGAAPSKENTPPRDSPPAQSPSAAPDPGQGVESGKPPPTRHSSGSMALLYLGGAAIVVLVLFRLNIIQFGETSTTPRIPYGVFWGSGQASMMEQVARAAVDDGDSDAERVILSDVFKGEGEHPVPIRVRLLRVGYNPLWQHELQDEDRELLLGLALSRMLPGRSVTLPNLTTLHPGVVAALAGDSDLTADFPELNAVSLVDLAELPPPFGPAYLELIKAGVPNLGDPVARAFSHVLAGDDAPAAVAAVFPEDLAPEQVIPRLKLMVSLISKMPGLEGAVLRGPGRRGALGDYLTWFEGEELVEWAKVSGRDKLAIIAGSSPTRGLTVEQLTDLLRFPLESVRLAALRRLESQVSPHSLLVLPYLARQDAAVSREQAVALVSALEVSGAAASTFIQGWFATEPSVKAVVNLLIARGEIKDIDAFNVEGARYLKNHTWDFSLDQIEALTRHGEPLVRALAYSRLDVRDTAQRTILEKAAAAETAPKLREQALQKLRIAD